MLCLLFYCVKYYILVVFSISSPSSSSSSAPSITSSSLTFTTAPLPSSSSCYFVNQEKKNNEKIIVEENNENISALSFIFGSCLGVSAFSSLRAFTYLLSQPVLPTFVILLGDIVYTDIPSIPDHLAYRQIYSDKSFGKLFQNIPFLGIYDDHEIANDWDITANISRYKEAMISFDKFVGDKNPKYKPIGEEEEIIKNKEEEDTMTKPRYFYSRYGSHVSYFVMDTRQYASPISFPADSPNKTKLGYKQLLAVKQWLLSTNTTFKFLCSPVCFSTNCHKPSTQLQDAWAGYLYERNEILNFIEENNINGVIILSADLHWSGVFQIRNFIYEMSISPIQSFPLPAYHTNGEDKTLWKGQMSQMFGQIEIIINKFTNIPAVQFTVYRYLYSTPRPDYELILYPQDLMKNNSRSNNNNKQEKLTGAHEEL